MTRKVARPERAALRALALTGVVGLSLLASACGGSSGAKVAQVGTSSGANGSGGAQPYSACMRNHGVSSFPDPGSDGIIQIPSTIDDHVPTVRAAYRACRSLAPSQDLITGAGPTMKQDQLLAFAKCMRSHRVPTFPDPQVVSGHINFPEIANRIDPNSPVVTAAEAACRSKLGANSGRGAAKLVQALAGPPSGKGK